MGGGRALALVAFLAVYREGAETALFYQALFNEGTHVALPISLDRRWIRRLAVIFTLFYRSAFHSVASIFRGASVLLYYMAFVFMGKGLRELQEGNAVPITVIPDSRPWKRWVSIPPGRRSWHSSFCLGSSWFALAKTFCRSVR